MPRLTRTPRHTHFRESLAPVMHSAPHLHISSKAIRYALYALWVLAAAAAGAAIGLYILSGRTVIADAPLPVATAEVTVGQPSLPDIAPASESGAPDLAISTSGSVDQSVTADLWYVYPASGYQPVAPPAALQPGFASFGFGQGSNGADPVVIR